jgi:hypothetical protein
MMCGVKANGTVACFSVNHPTTNVCEAGTSNDCFYPIPEGTYTSVSAGTNIACGVKTDGTIACWGLVDSSLVPAGTFSSVNVGRDGSVCAVRSDGTLACWYYMHGM